MSLGKLLLVPAIAVTIMVSGPPEVGESPWPKRVIVITATGLDFRDIENRGGHALTNLVASASLGAMNTRTAGPDTLGSSMVTLGAGTRMLGDEYALKSYAADNAIAGDRASLVMERRTGADAGQASAVCTGLPELLKANEASTYMGRPGLLGESLRQAGISATATGNSDDYTGPRRPAAVLCMDSHGLVPYGDIGPKTNTRDATYPFGLRSDIEALVSAVIGRDGLIAIDLGDFARAEAYERYAMREMTEYHRSRAYEALDLLLTRLFQAMGPPGPESVYILLSPLPSSRSQLKGSRLASLAIAGGRYGPGMVTSGTTRRTGLVANIDIAPTIISLLGATPAWPCHGRPMTPVPSSDALSAIVGYMNRAEKAGAARSTVLQTFIGLVTVAVALGTAVAILKPNGPWAYAAGLAITACTSGPLVLLLMPATGITGAAATIGLAVASALVMAVVAMGVMRSFVSAIVWISGLTAAAILIDLVLGARYVSASLLGYSPMIGARYYGIGNEYMGVLMGSLAVWAGGIAQVLRVQQSLYPGIIVGLGALITGLPMLGANLGGMLAGLVAAAMVACYGKSRYRLALALASLALVVAALITLDALRSNPTHVGMAFRSVIQAGPSGLMGIALRKLEMNIKLLRYTVWTRALITFLGALAIMVFVPSGLVGRFRASMPRLYEMLMGSVFGAAAALVWNDSGVVAAATFMMAPTFALLGYALDHKRGELR